ncbi:MAG: Asp-tRNA(Asn)/Glu-tRNA(Gln) amidotransferase subunit GatA, partial [Bacteroidetes bacterium]|nr:Asp-tRNA(Asn)/Glu-tRNA(Gln) amidotransferase subunit GatA [Bacteroidota bacterium]
MQSAVTYQTTRSALDRGETTCERTTADFLREIREKQRLNAFLSVFEDAALERAREIDRKRAAGRAGSLAGMVVAVKDVL